MLVNLVSYLVFIIYSRLIERLVYSKSINGNAISFYKQNRSRFRARIPGWLLAEEYLLI